MAAFAPHWQAAERVFFRIFQQDGGIDGWMGLVDNSGDKRRAKIKRLNAQASPSPLPYRAANHQHIARILLSAAGARCHMYLFAALSREQSYQTDVMIWCMVALKRVFAAHRTPYAAPLTTLRCHLTAASPAATTPLAYAAASGVIRRWTPWTNR